VESKYLLPLLHLRLLLLQPSHRASPWQVAQVRQPGQVVEQPLLVVQPGLECMPQGRLMTTAALT